MRKNDFKLMAWLLDISSEVAGLSPEKRQTFWRDLESELPEIRTDREWTSEQLVQRRLLQLILPKFEKQASQV
jgi:hypothetical protein